MEEITHRVVPPDGEIMKDDASFETSPKKRPSLTELGGQRKEPKTEEGETSDSLVPICSTDLTSVDGDDTRTSRDYYFDSYSHHAVFTKRCSRMKFVPVLTKWQSWKTHIYLKIRYVGMDDRLVVCFVVRLRI